MCAQKIRQLPLFLVQSRARQGLSQQALSERTGVLQTTLCALERGRRLNPGAALREALGRGLELSDADQVAMAVAIEHDRIVAEVERGRLKSAGPLVSAVLLAADRMTEVEREGLLRRIQRAMRTKEQHSALVHEPPVDAQGEEAEMT
jgi:transcriptional regulator with XRE-family HTH domain